MYLGEVGTKMKVGTGDEDVVWAAVCVLVYSDFHVNSPLKTRFNREDGLLINRAH